MERELSADVAGLVFPIPNAVRAHAERMAAALRAFFYFLFSVCEGGLQQKAPFFSVLQQTNNTQTRTHKWRLCVCACAWGGGMSGLPLRSDAAPCGRTARRQSDTKLCVRGGGVCRDRISVCVGLSYASARGGLDADVCLGICACACVSLCRCARVPLRKFGPGAVVAIAVSACVRSRERPHRDVGGPFCLGVGRRRFRSRFAA